MSVSMKRLTWWDRECDDAGRRIRSDVRLAAHEIWEEACRRTHSALADKTQAAELMESAVAEVSRYLDQRSAAVSSRKMNALLMLAFSRTLYRRAAKLNRIESVGASVNLENWIGDHNWHTQVDAHLELERIVRELSDRSGTILALRWAGYEWEEIAQLLGTSVAVIRNSFWREIRRVRQRLGLNGSHNRTKCHA